jgi:GNAT superfamily N-acetyltransferase
MKPGLGSISVSKGFEAELSALPGKYALLMGRLLAYSDENLAGCIAMRGLDETTCEMKRLFVRDGCRGQKIGLQLIERLIDVARAAGYQRMLLDTYPVRMGKAVELYRSHGFREIPPYYANPYDGVLFMELVL